MSVNGRPKKNLINQSTKSQKSTDKFINCMLHTPIKKSFYTCGAIKYFCSFI